MNYRIYHEGNEFRFTFNCLNTVGDLQTAIIQTLNIARDQLLYISYDNNILGLEYEFNENLLERDLYDLNLFVVMDYYRIANGSKNVYQIWLETQTEAQDLIMVNLQLMYHNTLNNSQSYNLDFFTNHEDNNSVENTITGINGTSTRSPNEQNQIIDRLRNQNISEENGPELAQERNRRQQRREEQDIQPNNHQPNNHQPNQPNNHQPNQPNNHQPNRRRPTRQSLGTSNSSNQTQQQYFMGQGQGQGQTGRSSTNYQPPALFGSLLSTTSPIPGTDGRVSRQTSRLSISSNGGGSDNFITQMMGELMNINNGGNGDGLTNLLSQMMDSNVSDFGLTMTQEPLMPINIPGGTDFFNYLMNLEPVPVTLSRENINALPIFNYNEVPKEIREMNATNCVICLDDYQDDDETRVLLCRHIFHQHCIDRWLGEENVRCPVCRLDNRTRDRQSETVEEKEDEIAEEDEIEEYEIAEKEIAEEEEIAKKEEIEKDEIEKDEIEKDEIEKDEIEEKDKVEDEKS